VANAEVHERMARIIVQLNEAMASRSVIDQALGIVIAISGCSAAQAFDLLQERSRNQTITVREVATQVVRDALRDSSRK
jgi:AmiR/NasT family two-component response regulator